MYKRQRRLIIKGLLVFVGINKNDSEESLDFIVDKLLNIKWFDGDKGERLKESVMSLNLEI